MEDALRDKPFWSWVQHLLQVLILVLMEDALRACAMIFIGTLFSIVLILVLMEDALRELLNINNMVDAILS